ncbi:enoyl-CoA hydratase/isomerase family protein [Methylocapsa sp. S129]|uniref:enoyl-CoA hydratase/isomerase family protein n=1 Tax=Methylocapsa sp. S129 TaxID=1641869 RepID=UPI00131AD26B|nr:enoyl-CoA hydratase/isomerase family protein [Methylocapsa sp. S129]
MSEPEVLVERRGCAGFLTLNRPKALNALNLGMVRAMAAALDDWERDAGVTRVVVTGAGGRAFCAGGDIRLLYEQGRAGDDSAQLAFWREEYQLNRRIKHYSKPYVALVDGIVMGGGVGVSAHGARLIAGESFVFAMPEVGIGFFPDVGATYLLPRLPHRAGVYLALTGARAGASDAVALGLAQALVPSARMSELGVALEDRAPIDSVVSQFASPAPSSMLTAQNALIETCFGHSTPAQIIAALGEAARGGSAFAKAAQEAMLAKSPTSQAIALRQMQTGGSLSFDEAMILEFRIVSRICRGHDFYEGVRAVIVDKDNQPQWRPGAAEDVSTDAVAAYFAPLGETELAFETIRR